MFAPATATMAARLNVDSISSNANLFARRPSGTSFRASLRSPETLVRLSADRLYSGGEILDAMLLRGEVHRFDSYCRQKAIRTGSLHHQPGKKLFINFQPSSIYDPAHCLRSTLHALSQTQLTPEDVVFEVVETEHVRDVAHLRRIADYYRDRGFGFALDDVGAGINTTDMVYAVRPDYVKIDKSLTRSADDAELQKALDAIVGCARDLGCAMIGEGVESATIAEWLLRRGVCLQQGWGTATYASHGARLHGLRCTGTTLFRQPVCSSEAKVEASGGPGLSAVASDSSRISNAWASTRKPLLPRNFCTT